MASDLEYVQHVCDQVKRVGDISYKKMFGEYAIYVGKKVVALICDNQLFVKRTDAGRELLGSPAEGHPFPGAKVYFMADEYLDDPALLCELFKVTETAVEAPKPKKKKRG